MAVEGRTLQTQGQQNHGGEKQQDMWCVMEHERRGQEAQDSLGEGNKIKNGCLCESQTWLVFCCYLEGYTLESLDEGQHRGQISKLTSGCAQNWNLRSGGKEAWEEAAVSSTQERRQGVDERRGGNRLPVKTAGNDFRT